MSEFVARLRTTTAVATIKQGRISPVCEAEPVVAVFEAELRIWDARRVDGWTFVSLPAEASEDIRDTTAGSRRCFGSSRVRVTVGASTWTTWIFPDSARGTYVLPMKRSATPSASTSGDIPTVAVELIDP